MPGSPNPDEHSKPTNPARRVRFAPSPIAVSGLGTRPDAITIWVPPAVAILAASIFVCMPPRERSDPAAPAIASMAGVMRSISGTSLGWVPVAVRVPGGAS